MVILKVIDGNGDALRAFVVKDGWSREKEFRKRLQAFGFDLVQVKSWGDESQLAQYVKRLEDEYDPEPESE